MSIRVLVVDDQALVRAGFVKLLEPEHDLQVVGEAGDGSEAVEAAARMRPDVILMDIRMPRLERDRSDAANPRGVAGRARARAHHLRP